MPRKDDVEFLADDRPLPSGEDLIDLGRGRFPRWVAPVSAAVVALVAAAFALGDHSSHQASHPATPTPAAPSPVPVLAPGLGSPLAIGSAVPIGVTSAFGRLYVLQVGRLIEVDPATSEIVAQVPIAGMTSDSPLRLVADPSAFEIWVVTMNASPTLIMSFDQSLHEIRDTTWTRVVTDAVALNSSLYVVTGSGVAVLGKNDNEPQPVAALADSIEAIAADPKNDQLVVIDGDMQTISVYEVSSATMGLSVAFDIGKATLAVAGNEIWVAGFSDQGAVLDRFSTDLSVVTPVPLASTLGAGAVVAAAGDDDVWVRNDGDDTSLWCVDARTGAGVQRWPNAPGAVTSEFGNAFLASAAAVQPLLLIQCSG